MIDRKQLLSDLQALLKTLEADLLERSESAEVPDVGRKLREEYIEAQAANRTAQNYEEWRSDEITQVAAAWVLSCVFGRFLEDNQLVPTPKIAGPGEGLKRARDEHEVYFRRHPTLTDRDYLLGIFDDLTRFGATKEVFGAHNPIRDLPNWLSGDAAGALIAFFQKIDPNTGVLVHDFTDPEWDTRFLGDLYQDLSEEARKKYALLQTPVFVEEFILDRTLDPAIEEFGLAKPGYETRVDAKTGRLDPDDRFKMIDPACGSGHFLLGSFARLVNRWRKKDPGAKVSVLVQRALDGVHGVDVNPYAIAIARFRLLLAALKECGFRHLSDAPGFDIHLACGDSLLHGSPGGDQVTMGWAPTDHVYQPEDRHSLERLLQPKSYRTVVANPPYITPKDAALNIAYRQRYTSCHRQYSLAVPFLERIISLAIEGGFTGQITANSFMKREFGKKLIEEFLPRVDLTHVIDTSGAYIPGHGTPTVILFARNQKPVGSKLLAVMGIRGEPSTPIDPAQGLVWSAVVAQIEQPGSQSEFVSVASTHRELFHKHPWSISGGGASELKLALDAGKQSSLADEIGEVGIASWAGIDEVFVCDHSMARRKNWETHLIRSFVAGETIRDWMIASDEVAAIPYDKRGMLIPLPHMIACARSWWLSRRHLESRVLIGGMSVSEAGQPYYAWVRWMSDRYAAPIRLAFAFIATHNRFIIDRGGYAFNRSAPIITLKHGANEEQLLGILGLLNSSTACFWMKQVFMPKGGHGIGRGIQDEAWEGRLEFDGTKLKQFPLPDERPLSLAKLLDSLGQELQQMIPANLLNADVPNRSTLANVRVRSNETPGQMVAAQEELDWDCYRYYGLIEENLSLHEAPPIGLGQRSFEIVLARKLAARESQTAWFERHGSIPVTELPAEWPEDYRQLVERRIALIESDPNIGLIEQPEYKRRWNTEPWDSQLKRALNAWLLDRLESYFDFDGRMNDAGKPTARLDIALTTVGKLADIARQDPDFLQVGELYRGDPAFDVTRLVAELVEGESVPLLPILRYKPSGLRKREEWEKT